MEEKRRFPRFTMAFPVECKEIPKKDYFFTVSKDLSKRGIKIISAKFLPKNNSIIVNINLIDHLVQVKARVVWCNKERLSERYLAGLEFMEINEDNSKVLDNLFNKITTINLEEN